MAGETPALGDSGAGMKAVAAGVEQCGNCSASCPLTWVPVPHISVSVWPSPPPLHRQPVTVPLARLASWHRTPQGHKTGMRHRTLRVCGSVSVQPLLAARPSVWPSPTHLAQHLLRLTIENSKVGERGSYSRWMTVWSPID